jgi:polysaccharide export outer membrane protein
MRNFWKRILLLAPLLLIFACTTGGDAVQDTTVSNEALKGLEEKDFSLLAEIKKEKQSKGEDVGLKSVIKETPNYNVAEYLALHQNAKTSMLQDYRVGGYDVLHVIVYEEADLSRENIRVSADGYISFPLIGRVKVDGLTTSEIETFISRKLAEGQFVLDAHVAVLVSDYKSKQFMVLGSVKAPGTYPLQGKERVLDAISRAGGIDFEQGGKEGMIIRTEKPNTSSEQKVVIRFELTNLLKGGDQTSNLFLANEDLVYIPKAEYFYVIGQVENPGSYPYLEKEVTLVEALSMAGGFTPIAARNRTRIIRQEEGAEKTITVKVDEITRAGKKSLDVRIEPGDVIVVPESFF